MDRDRTLEKCDGFGNAVAVTDDLAAEVVGSHPAVGIVRDGRAIKRLNIIIHPALLPAQPTERSDDDAARCPTNTDGKTSECRREGGGGQRDERETGQILPVVRDKRIGEAEDVEEPEDRK